jgi:hypothetical protein
MDDTQLFDEFGRCVPLDLENKVYKQSRRYFLCESPSIDFDEIFDRISKHLGVPDDLTREDFAAQARSVITQIESDQSLANMTNGIYVPFFIPRDTDLSDIGKALDERYLPAVSNAYTDVMPDYEFKSESKALAGKVSVTPDSRHQLLIDQLSQQSVVGVYFASMSEFSKPAALEGLRKLPGNILLAGGVDLSAVMVACPNLLIRESGYPPTLWMSALQGENENIGYHYEAYGYNLNFYRRSHLGGVAEYWWQGLTVLATA